MADNKNKKLVLTKVGIKNQKCGIRFHVMASLILMFNVLFFISGCVPQKRSCQPILNAVQGQQTLSNYYANVKPFRATGVCTVNLLGENGKRLKQSFPVRIWYLNSDKFCMYGDVIFNPQAICFAVSDGIYWIYAKPINLYINGVIDYSNTSYNEIFANPGLLVDFLRPLGADSFAGETAFANNILISSKDEKSKKIYIDKCEKAVRKIEYFNCDLLDKNSKCGNKKAVLVINAGKYEQLKDGPFSFPHKLKYEYYDRKNGKSQMEIKLDSVKLWQPEEQQIKALFTPPMENNLKKESK
jgi:hypothetical protein